MTGTKQEDGTGKPGPDGPGRPDARRSMPSRPHENVFRVLLSDPARVQALFRDHLPNDIAGLLADTLPVQVDGTFVDEALRDSRSDFLFEVELKSGKPAFLLLLVEHKSRPDPATPLQLAGYMVRIWLRYAQGRAERLRALPPIVPMVLYHGQERWSVPDGIGEMIASTVPALLVLPGERYILRNLAGLPVEQLSRDPVLRSALIILIGQALKYMQAIADGLEPEAELQRLLGEYIFATYPEADLGRLTEAWQAIVTEPLGEMMATIAQRLRQEGRTEGWEKGLQEGESIGLEKGLQEGEARFLTRLLERRFGPLSDEFATRIAAADTSQLERWLEAAVDAPTCEAVFHADKAH